MKRSYRWLVWSALLAASAGPAPAGGPWRRHTIDKTSRGADGTRLADVNADGLADVVTGWEEGGVTRVYLNPGPARARKPWPAVTVGRTRSVEDAVFADLDADGAVDVVSCCEGRTRCVFFHWAPKRPGAYLDAAAWQTAALPASRGVMCWMFATPVQLDGRNGVDIVAGGKARGAKVGWFRAPADPRDLAGWTWHPLLDAAWIMSLLVEDMDGDGDGDILLSERRGRQPGCLWLANPGPGEAQSRPWPVHRIGPTGREAMFLYPADLDGDGLRDILVARKPREIAFFRRLDGSGQRWSEQVIATPPTAGTAKGVAVGDIDLDGRADIVFSCEAAEGARSGVMWLRREGAPHGGGGAQGAWAGRDISGPEGVKFDLVRLLDLDADGDLDVLTCEERANLGVIWYENPTRSAASGR